MHALEGVKWSVEHRWGHVVLLCCGQGVGVSCVVCARTDMWTEHGDGVITG